MDIFLKFISYLILKTKIISSIAELIGFRSKRIRAQSTARYHGADKIETQSAESASVSKLCRNSYAAHSNRPRTDGSSNTVYGTKSLKKKQNYHIFSRSVQYNKRSRHHDIF